MDKTRTVGAQPDVADQTRDDKALEELRSLADQEMLLVGGGDGNPDWG